MDFLKINENLINASKFLYESNDYKLTIITGRDRDSIGVLQNITIKAENDLDALLQVFKGYDLQNAGMFNGEYTDEDLTEEDKRLKEQILTCVKQNKIEEGVKLLTDLYFDNFDISDYYADIVKLEGPNGVVIEDDLDLSDWDDDELDTEDYEDDFKDKKEKKTKQDILDAMYLDILDALPKKLFVTHRTAEAPGKERMDIVLLTDHNKIIGNIHTDIKTGYDAFEEGNMEDRLLEGTIQDLQDWLKRHYSKVK